MRRRPGPGAKMGGARRVGLCLVAVGLLCAVAVAPLLRGDSPCTHDSALHYYRVVAMRHALEDGVLFTRYVPDLAFGYGYPFFNYRAAVSYYLALGFYLAGTSLPMALDLVYVVSIVGSALAAYLLARDLFGPWAGIVAAVAYAYAPYQFLDGLVRANGPESVALPLFPLILWAFRRLFLTGRVRWFAASVLSYAILLLTHAISSLLFTPFLVAYLFVLVLIHGRRGHWLAAGVAFGLALGLTAFYWAPAALLERDLVQLHLSRTTRNNDFHYNFVSLAEIFSPPRPVDTSLMNPPMQVHLGLPQAILAVVGMVAGTVRWRDRERRGLLLFFALAALVLIGCSTQSSVWLWERLPLVAFVQFPWRLVGRAALPVALLAGAAVPALRPSGGQAPRSVPPVVRYLFGVLPFLVVLLFILLAFPYTYPPHGYCPNPARPTIQDLFEYERVTKLVGVDPEGSYFPIWVEERPEGSPLEAMVAGEGPVERFDGRRLPEGAEVIEADYGPNRARIVIETPQPFQARYLAFYFPGWRVWVDGERVAVAPSSPEGLITFDVPAGRHTIDVRFGETPARLAADGLSLLALVAFGVLMARYPFTPRVSPGRSQGEGEPQGPAARALGPSRCWLMIGLAALLLVVKLVVIDRVENPFRRPTLQAGGSLPAVQHPVDQAYADGLVLIGFDVDRKAMAADGQVQVDLYWTARARPTDRYQTTVRLLDKDGLRWSTPEGYRPRGYADHPPTTTWGPDRYALDSHQVELLPGTPPGSYDLVLTVFDRHTLAPLSTVDDAGRPVAPTLTLGQVTVVAPRQAMDAESSALPVRLGTSLGPVTLAGAHLDRHQAAPGDEVLFTAFWSVEEPPAEELRLRLVLRAPDGEPAAEYDLPLTRPDHPAMAWRPGDLWRGQHLLRLPATLGDGEHTWALAVEPLSAVIDLPSTLAVAAPPHTFDPPPVRHTLVAPLGSLATLVGFELSPEDLRPGETFTTTLVWRAEETADVSYHVFVHLLGPDGSLVAQSDGVPAEWTRPTTGWIPGEFVSDRHRVTVPAEGPPGTYVLVTGIYLPGEARLAGPDGSTAVHLTSVPVQEP